MDRCREEHLFCPYLPVLCCVTVSSPASGHASLYPVEELNKTRTQSKLITKCSRELSFYRTIPASVNLVVDKSAFFVNCTFFRNSEHRLRRDQRMDRGLLHAASSQSNRGRTLVPRMQLLSDPKFLLSATRLLSTELEIVALVPLDSDTTLHFFLPLGIRFV